MWWRRVDRVKSMKWYALLGLCALVLACEIHEYQPPHYLYRLFDAPNLPNIILMLVGIGGVWAALRTLKAIEKQVDAQVNAERAWMEVEIELGPSRVAEVTSGRQPTNTVAECDVKWMNVGRTPAWISATQISMMMLPDETHAPKSLPEPGFPSIIGPQMVGGNDKFEQRGTVSAEGRLSQKQVGLVYGSVSYYDIFKQHHTTTFGFILQENRTVRRLNFMYPAFNEHT
jgi:uncharacterized membrane protein YuzA (DUF378 family)